jgi:hypothetical protein
MLPPVSAGSGGDGEGGAPVEAATDVSGQVLAGLEPFAGAVVVVGGVTTLSGADGRFVVHHAAAEYQLMVRDPKTKSVLVYEGLKTRELRVNLGTDFGGVVRSATVRGKLLAGGLGDPAPSGARKQVVYLPKHFGSSTTDFQAPLDSFEVQPSWLGDASDEGEVWAVQYLHNIDDGAHEYLGFGRRKVSVTDMGTVGSVDGDAATDVTMTDPVDVTLETHTTAPAGWDVYFIGTVNIGPLSAQIYPVLGDSTLVIPKLDVPLLVETTASGPEGDTVVDVAPPAQGVTLNIVHPKPPQPTSPDDKATGITSDTELFWEGMPENSVANVTVQLGDWRISITTAAGSVKLPDLTPLHVHVPGNISGTWRVGAIGPAATVEQALARDDQTTSGTKLAGFASTANERDFVTGE